MTTTFDAVRDILAQDAPANAPEGYVALPRDGNFAQLFGPIYGRLAGEKTLIGFRCSARHLNPMQICHGGVIACFADLQAYGMERELGYAFEIKPTVTLTIDYLDGIRASDWVEAETIVLRRTNRMVFSTMTGRVEGRPVFHARGIYRIRDVVDRSSLVRKALLEGRTGQA